LFFRFNFLIFYFLIIFWRVGGRVQWNHIADGPEAKRWWKTYIQCWKYLQSFLHDAVPSQSDQVGFQTFPSIYLLKSYFQKWCYPFKWSRRNVATSHCQKEDFTRRLDRQNLQTRQTQRNQNGKIRFRRLPIRKVSCPCWWCCFKKSHLCNLPIILGISSFGRYYARMSLVLSRTAIRVATRTHRPRPA
jgi:hypothetical protein